MKIFRDKEWGFAIMIISDGEISASHAILMDKYHILLKDAKSIGFEIKFCYRNVA